MRLLIATLILLGLTGCTVNTNPPSSTTTTYTTPAEQPMGTTTTSTTYTN